MATQVRETGRLTTIVPSKGFGFVRPDDGSQDRFVHASQFPNGVELSTRLIGCDVSFTPAENPRTGQPIALEIRFVKD